MELVLEQTQQGTSYEVSVSAEGVEKLKRKIMIKGEKKEVLLTLRFDTLAGNLVKEILLKLNLPDHRSILTDSKIVFTLYERLHSTEKTIRNGARIREAKPPSGRRKTVKEGLPQKRSSPADKDNQCELGKGQEAKSTRGNKGLDERPYNLPGDILRGRLRRAFNRRGRGFSGEISKPFGKIELEVRTKDPAGYSIYHSLHDEIPHPERRGYFSHLDSHYRGVHAVREETNDRGGELQRGKGGQHGSLRMGIVRHDGRATENHRARIEYKPLFRSGATYQRLVDSTFQSHIRRNLEAYVDDVVIKSKEEKMLLADIAETFENLKKINMKLNPKKCFFGVEEGKFLRFMVTSKGIRANPKKTKALADLQSLRTLKEMQSMSGKLAALNRFLAKSAERSLPFFNTLKNKTKENKHEYQWTKEAEEAFQQMNKLILDLPSLTPSWPKETLYAYLAVATEAVSAVLLIDRKGRKCLIQYVSRTLNEVERNYTPWKSWHFL
ncbi:reverse transcriptase domain-containing protein [Tanacetum coccineum]